MACTVNLMVGKSSSGAPVYEEVLVEPMDRARYRLLRSPGLALGMAADDVFELEDDGTFKLIQRGRNVCVQIFCASNIDEVEEKASTILGKVGARLDGKAATELVYTVSVDVGFPALEQSLKELSMECPVAEWYFGNVYDLNDGVTPLNWWIRPGS